jgi:hypothetical protein
MFTDRDLDLIRETVERFSTLSRTELALTLCENLPWQAPNGQARLRPCLSLLERMDGDCSESARVAAGDGRASRA